MNQDVKYKRITYGNGAGKTFLDEAAFMSEDELSDFELSQAYTNWLTLIEVVSDPIIEQDWHSHHKRMVLDRGFQDWVPAWHTHDRLLRSRFMLKPLILDPSSTTYENQLEQSKLDQALQGSHRSPHDYLHPGSCGMDTLKPINNLQHHNSGSPNVSLQYKPYPKANPSSFIKSGGPKTLCIHCRFKGHWATACTSMQSS